MSMKNEANAFNSHFDASRQASALVVFSRSIQSLAFPEVLQEATMQLCLEIAFRAGKGRKQYDGRSDPIAHCTLTQSFSRSHPASHIILA